MNYGDYIGTGKKSSKSCGRVTMVSVASTGLVKHSANRIVLLMCPLYLYI